MNKEVWYQIFSEWVKSYESINYLSNKGVLHEDEYIIAKHRLLNDIIETISGEIEDD